MAPQGLPCISLKSSWAPTPSVTGALTWDLTGLDGGLGACLGGLPGGPGRPGWGPLSLGWTLLPGGSVFLQCRHLTDAKLTSRLLPGAVVLQASNCSRMQQDSKLQPALQQPAVQGRPLVPHGHGQMAALVLPGTSLAHCLAQCHCLGQASITARDGTGQEEHSHSHICLQYHILTVSYFYTITLSDCHTVTRHILILSNTDTPILDCLRALRPCTASVPDLATHGSRGTSGKALHGSGLGGTIQGCSFRVGVVV